MILWCPLDIRFDINSPAELYEIRAKKPHLFSSFHLQALLFQQNIISKSASCISRKHNSSSYLDKKKN